MTMKKTALLCALDNEITGVTDYLSDVTRQTDFGIQITKGFLGNNQVIMATTGVGKAAAAASAQHIISLYKIDEILNIGMAGSCNNTLGVGGCVVAKECAYHDFYLTNPEEYEVKTTFSANEELSNKAFKVCCDMGLKVIEGKVATGDRFVEERTIKEEIKLKTQCDCVDMECAAIAQVAERSQVPLAIIKILSDSADENALSDFIFSTELYSDMAAKIACEFIGRN